jgi:hypothetical protein
MSEGICAWYGFEKDELRAYVDERGQPKYFCDGDTQTVIVHYIQCVKIDEIKKEDVWNPGRLERIRTWATPDRLRRVKLSDHHIYPLSQLPDLSRCGHFPEIQKEKFDISNGIHRIAFARETGLDCILADVEEGIEVKRSDTHLYKTN